MKPRFLILQIATLICSAIAHAQSTNEIILTRYPQKVPSGKVWYINNTQSIKISFIKDALTSGTACNAAFYSNPRFTSGIQYIGGKSMNTNLLLFTFKEATTMDNIVYNIKPIFFLDDAEKIPQALTWKFSPVEIKFYTGTNVWLTQCFDKMTIFERNLKPGETPVSSIGNFDKTETPDGPITASSPKPEFNVISQAKDFREGMAQVAFTNPDNEDLLYGYLNMKGELAVQPQFIEANSFKNGFALVSKERGRYMFIDKSGKNLLSEPLMFGRDFSDGFAAIRPFTSGGWNFVNTKGLILTKSSYKEVRDFHEGYAAVKTQGGWGFIDTTGREVIVPQFENVGDFSEGVALTKKYINYHLTEYKYIDPAGTVVLPLRAGDVPIQSYNQSERTITPSDFHNGHIIVNLNPGLAVLDKTGKTIIKDKGEIYSESEGLYLAKYFGYYGYINSKGKWEITCKFDKAHDFSEGLAVVRINDNYGYIDKTGQVIINQDILKSKSEVRTNPAFQNASDFAEGLAVVEIGGKYGYIDHTGNWVIKPTLVDASLYHEGIAAVRFADKKGWTYIDKQGNILYPRFQ